VSRVVAICFAAAMIDGFDTLVVAFIAPALAWGSKPESDFGLRVLSGDEAFLSGSHQGHAEPSSADVGRI
jgi:hypothetical protein